MKKTIDDTLYYIMDKTGHSQWDDPRKHGIIDYKDNKLQNDNSSILTKATNIVKNITKKNSELKEPSAVNIEYDDTFESDDSFNEP